MAEARLSEEKARCSMLDAARLAEELRAEQEPVFISEKYGGPSSGSGWRHMVQYRKKCKCSHIPVNDVGNRRELSYK